MTENTQKNIALGTIATLFIASITSPAAAKAALEFTGLVLQKAAESAGTAVLENAGPLLFLGAAAAGYVYATSEPSQEARHPA